MTHLLYGAFANRYDLHTPPSHYRHDHEFILARACALGRSIRLLDIGCGTGVLVEKALAAGIDAYGLDPAPAMLEQARSRLPSERLLLGRMQELASEHEYDLITALSWSFNYCADLPEASDVLERCYRALRPGGVCILQLAHAPQTPIAPPEFMVDIEPGPAGPGDIIIRYRFWSKSQSTMIADYEFECRSTGEAFSERHELHAADIYLVATRADRAGFRDMEILANCRAEPFEPGSPSISPFLIARKPR